MFHWCLQQIVSFSLIESRVRRSHRWLVFGIRQVHPKDQSAGVQIIVDCSSWCSRMPMWHSSSMWQLLRWLQGDSQRENQWMNACLRSTTDIIRWKRKSRRKPPQTPSTYVAVFISKVCQGRHDFDPKQGGA
jgi:hypothetical protein